MIDDKNSLFISEVFDEILKTYVKQVCEPSEFLEEEGFFRAYSGMNSPNHNMFYQDVIPDKLLEKTARETIEYYSKNKSPFTWWVSEETITPTVRKTLLALKFRYFGDIRGLSVNLADLNKSFDTPNSLYTQQITGKEKLSEWTRIAAPIYNLRNNNTATLDAKLKSRHGDTIRRYLSFLAGDPVSCSLVIESMGVAGVIDDEIIPYYNKYDPFRLAVIYYPLKEAQKRGINVGIGFADTKRINYYKMLGFEEVHQYHKFVFVPKKTRTKKE